MSANRAIVCTDTTLLSSKDKLVLLNKMLELGCIDFKRLANGVCEGSHTIFKYNLHGFSHGFKWCQETNSQDYRLICIRGSAVNSLNYSMVKKEDFPAELQPYLNVWQTDRSYKMVTCSSNVPLLTLKKILFPDALEKARIISAASVFAQASRARDIFDLASIKPCFISTLPDEILYLIATLVTSHQIDSDVALDAARHGFELARDVVKPRLGLFDKTVSSANQVVSTQQEISSIAYSQLPLAFRQFLSAETANVRHGMASHPTVENYWNQIMAKKDKNEAYGLFNIAAKFAKTFQI